MAKRSPRDKKYENNPFFVATNGITLLFSLAPSVGVLLIVLSLLGVFTNPSMTQETTENRYDAFMRTVSTWSTSDWILAIGATSAIVLAILMVTALFGGVASYTSARVARGKEVNVGKAFHVAFENLWAYLWLQVLMFVKLLLWTLLFVIPGIIMSIRYSLAGVAFYDEKKNLRGNAAIQESIGMTRGAWITTFASNMLLNLLTFGAISQIVSTGVNAVLYRQYEKSGDKKPKAHTLSWVTLIIPVALFALGIVIMLTEAK